MIKRKDVWLIVIIGVFTAFIGLILVSQVFNAGERSAEVEVVEPLPSEFDSNAEAFFNRQNSGKEDFSSRANTDQNPQGQPFGSLGN